LPSHHIFPLPQEEYVFLMSLGLSQNNGNLPFLKTTENYISLGKIFFSEKVNFFNVPVCIRGFSRALFLGFTTAYEEG